MVQAKSPCRTREWYRFIDECHDRIASCTSDPNLFDWAGRCAGYQYLEGARCQPHRTLRANGRISLPLINDIQAAGLSSEQLSATIAEKLRKFLTEPQVTVIVTAINSQRVFVVGEVLRVGAFPLLPGTTVLQALASASGFTTFADVRKIHVMRVRNGKPVELSFNYREVLKGNNRSRASLSSRATRSSFRERSRRRHPQRVGEGQGFQAVAQTRKTNR